MIFTRKKFEKKRVVYDYFLFGKKILNENLYFVSVFRNITMQKHRFLRRKINSVIYLEGISLVKKEKIRSVCYDLAQICEILRIEVNESVLKNNLKVLLESVKIFNNELCLYMKKD